MATTSNGLNSLASSDTINRSTRGETSRRPFLRELITVAIVAAVYFAAARLGLSFASIHQNVSPIWPPTGVAIAAVLLFGNRIWPAVFLGAFAANALSPLSIAGALGIAAGNTLEALCGGMILRRWRFDVSLKSAGDVFKFVIAACACTTVSASIGTLTVCLSEPSVWQQFGSVWVTWWLGDVGGAVTIAPLLITWFSSDGIRLDGLRSVETTLLALLISIAAFATFGRPAPIRLQYYPLTRLIIPFLLWAAFRLGHRGVTLVVLIQSAFAVWGTSKGAGPFVSASSNESLLILQLFISTNAVTFLFLASVIEERRQAQQEVQTREAELHLVTDATPVMLTRCSRDLRYVFANRAYAAMLGREPSEIVGKPIAEIMGEDGLSSIRPHISQVLQGKQVEYEQEVSFKGVGTRVLHAAYRPDVDSKGKPIGWVASIVDVTERRRAQEAQLRSEKELNEFFENATECIHWVGPDGTILRANRAELRMLGYEPDEYIGFHLSKFHVDQKSLTDILGRLVCGETLTNHPARMRRKDGTVIDVVINSSPYFEDGKFVHSRCFTRDVTEQLRTDEALRELAYIVENTDDAIIGRDLNGIVTSWNRGAEKLYGYKADEIIGKPLTILVPVDRRDEDPEILARLRSGQVIDHYETVRVAKDGRHLHVSLTSSPIRNGNGEIIGYSKIARDITERHRSEIEREALLKSEHEARAQAEEANRVKDEFLAVLSHELRTPLNAILGWASLLKGGKLDAENALRALDIVERNAKAQSKLIEGVLDVSRIVSGKLQLDVRPTQLSTVVQTAIDSIRPAADAKHMTLRVEIQQPEPLVLADSNRLQQVVWNLLSNAVKFSAAGGEIVVSLVGSPTEVCISVQDDGQGIAPEFLPHVFDRFRQADSTTTRRHGGLGLGLAIVRHLVELHGGTVEALSDGVGRGATFIVRLRPLEKGEDESARKLTTDARSAYEDPSSLVGVKILIVDDHEDGREVLREMLAMCDADVKAVSSAAEALNLVREWQPQVVVSDISMPDVDGYTFIRQLRALDGTGDIPAIAVTAHALAEDRARSLAAGFQHHLAKPIQLSELTLSIAKVVGLTPDNSDDAQH